MIYEISNGRFTARVDTLGAQLVSLQEGGFEHIWVGDPSYWREHAPVLFPIVGAIREGRTQINGQWYEMGRHGFAKKTEFALAEQGEDRIALRLTANDSTRAAYPFEFALTVAYTLTEKGIDTRFTVENTGGVELPYSIGGHPGFNIPVNEAAAFEDYTIEFEEEEDQTCPLIDMQAGLINWNGQGFRLIGKEIPLQHSLFYRDALVFENLRSKKVRVVNRSTGRGVEMDFSGFPLLGIWSAANDGPYVCLEPWTGCATGTEEGDQFIEKKGMALLAPGEKAEHQFAVDILG
ncbi:aldose 1-epimerase family protein [Acutalibacter sp. 1XD8-33]|uniref:aldose 1-epimerase family protein n=1 Tax=Acutalibacter sp. 1XD8-33 TaxID=2320081 RepID=UPI000EA0C81D|nr:aldose 1-epimerase family protein [Acutalibacter sp. 1XD8-33]RKJ42037.1 aldose 1-epimerase family protein [Acutalibacter sp. 1XD8-33]